MDAVERFRRPAVNEFVHGSAVPVHELDDAAGVVDGELVEPDAPTTGRVRDAVGRVIRRPGVLSLDDLVHRDRVRAKYRARAGRVVLALGTATIRTGVGGGRLVLVVGRGVGRWLWMPERGRLVDAMADGAVGVDLERALRNRKDLSRTRRTRVLGTGGTLLVGGLTAWALDDRLVAAAADVPTWTWAVATAATAAGCWLLGRPGQVVDVDPAPGGALVAGLSQSMTTRAVHKGIEEAFADLRIRGQVVKVRAHDWGWLVTAEVVTHLTEPLLTKLALQLDTRRGGLLVNTVAESERSRVFRLVMRDLLAPGQVPPPVELGPHQDIHTPVLLARRFDGADWLGSLASVHVLVIGRTGSGKTTVLHRLVEAALAAGAVVGGIDLTSGPSLRSWLPALEPRLCEFSDSVPDALTVASLFVAITRDRKARVEVGGEPWRSTRADPPMRLVIDEYGTAADHKALREAVEYIVQYGRQVDVCVYAANHAFTNDSMGGGKVNSQAQVKIICGMDDAHAVLIPKGLRESGVRPGQLQPALGDDPRDAGKAFVVGVEPVPFMARFWPYPNTLAARRAVELVDLGAPRLTAADEQVVDAFLGQNEGVPDLVLAVYDAIVAHSADRDPPRAESEEIAAYLNRTGPHQGVTAATLTVRLRAELGEAFPSKRRQDTNVNGRNLKGWYLDDLDSAIERYRKINATS